MIGFFLSFLAYSCLASGLGLAFGAVMEVRHAFRLWIAKRIQAGDARNTTGIFDVRGRAHAEIPLQAPLTRDPRDITLFKSVGAAVEDLAAAMLIWRTLAKTG